MHTCIPHRFDSYFYFIDINIPSLTFDPQNMITVTQIKIQPVMRKRHFQ
ncbi:hypothetical protein SAMN05518672_1011194 [Chitinophaga sp. CF118]|nr:hypothetical protein SAMN05518672_1011194 [Chitinophaga sp. CF118]